MDLKILVIIVTFNSKPWIKKCLDSLSRSNYNHDIILIDNNSDDGSLDYVKENYKNIKVVEVKENLGFGRANNIGFKYALDHLYDYVLLLNQDVYVEPNMIESLVTVALNNPDIGILSPLHLSGDGSSLDKNFSIAVSQSNKDLNSLENIQKYTQELFETKFVMAAIWLLERDVLEKVGGFNPIFNHYGEDNDYVNRVLYHGKKIGIYSSTAGYHDREFRKISEEKRLYIYGYVKYLYLLTNINENFYLCLMKFFSFFFIRSIQIVIKGNLKLLLKNAEYLIIIIKKLQDIKVSRRLTKRDFHTFINS